MFLPIGDIPNPKGTPYVNYALIALNIAIFVIITLPLSGTRPDINNPVLIEYLRSIGGGPWSVQAVYQRISEYDLFIFQYGYRPAAGSLFTMFSAMFLHANWMHLAGNMLFLWIFGDNVEHRLGSTGYLLAYIGAGLAATLFFGQFVPGSQVPMIGASGAISGILGFYFLWFPGNKVKIFIFLFPLLMTTILVPARIVLGFFLLIDNLLPFLLTSQQGGGGVAHGAHIGGFLAGVALAYGIDRLPGLLHQRRSTPKGVSRSGTENIVAALTDAVNEGRLADAVEQYALLEGKKERSQVDADKLLAIGEYLLNAKQSDRARTVFRRIISEHPGDAHLDRAYLGAGKAMLQKARCDTSAWHYFVAAVDLARTPALAEEARSCMRSIERCRD